MCKYALMRMTAMQMMFNQCIFELLSKLKIIIMVLNLKDLLLRYGQEMVLVDSTYKTTRYEVPLFFVCVLTGIGYSPICSFVVRKETIEDIKEALNVIKFWN